MIYEFLAEGFEETEALCPLDLLRRSGAPVKTVCVSRSEEDGERLVTGAHGISVTADLTTGEAASLLSEGRDDTEMILLPGGMPGTKNLDGSALVDRFIRRAVETDAFLCAICAAPMLLGKRGILDKKRATCFPGFEDYLNRSVIGGRVVRDGKIITACGMGAALEFGLALVAARDGEKSASELAKSVLAGVVEPF